MFITGIALLARIATVAVPIIWFVIALVYKHHYRILYAILPAGEAKAVNRLCSRSGPNVDSRWAIDANEVKTLEARLPDISKLVSGGAVRITISDPFQFYRQYVGIVVGGRRLIYVNAFATDFVFKDWKTRIVNHGSFSHHPRTGKRSGPRSIRMTPSW